ncbi:biopolymer transporter ExbD [Candidatus Aerophobetes bacterium Ae_b3a]|nr:MAG: biopolymer transporter ExbD [Candidatus Aerophobetes bacterium Ae_b3a]
MRFRRAVERREAAFDLMPLIDVVFLLIIFFMLTTSFRTIFQGIKVDLPTTTTKQERIEQNIIVTITKDNVLYLDKARVATSKLVSLLKKKLREKKGLVMINADKLVRHGKVVEIMDLAKQAGADRVGILTSYIKVVK